MKLYFTLPTHLFVLVAATFTLLLFLYFLLVWRHNIDTKPNLPEPSGSWPVIGHLNLLRGLPHIALGLLADKYGPIFMIRLGVHRALVVSNPEMAKECLGTNDRVFVGRPKTVFVDHLTYGSANMGFSPYGPYWHTLRRITALGLLSNQRVKMLKHIRTSEIRAAVKSLHDDCSVLNRGLVDMKQWFNEVNLNTTVSLIAGNSWKEGTDGDEIDNWKNALRDWFKLAGTFVPADAVPYLRWLDIGGYEKAMKKVAKEIDVLPQRWLEEHRRQRASGQQTGSQDFIDLMIEILETGQNKPFEFDADTVIKATCMAMILGGTDTTTVTLVWALSLLLNNKESLKKAQEELDIHVGKERQVNESDLNNLIYLQAILKETMRLYPAAPIPVPRETIKDCAVSDYHIPAGTRLIVNLYKIHRDPRVWPDPLDFRPERFLTTHKDYDVRGQNFELMPFGNGRRICPGVSFALQAMQFTLANLLHGFDISTPSGEKVDMTEGHGLTNLKVSPLQVILVPILADKLY